MARRTKLGIYMDDVMPLERPDRQQREPLACETALVQSLHRTRNLMAEVREAHGKLCDCLLCEDVRGLAWSLDVGIDLIEGTVFISYNDKVKALQDVGLWTDPKRRQAP